MDIACMRLWRPIHNRLSYSFVGFYTACGWALPFCTSVQVATRKVVSTDCYPWDIPQLSVRSKKSR
jgi:hypothetical protein